MSIITKKKAVSVLCVICLFWTSSIYSAHAAPQPLEYLTDEFTVYRVEPEGDGKVYDVRFNVVRGPVTEPFAALEGHGLGEEQWLQDPVRENYTFLGWFDNPEGEGTQYTKDTPIYKDTELYAAWKYIGSGGCWPRTHRGIINGIEEGSIFNINQTISITAEGYNMNLNEPKDQRFRWKPDSYRVSDSIISSFAEVMPFLTTFSIDNQGDYKLYITYKEEIFDGVTWQETSQVHEVEELSFQVIENNQ